jgi:hypothetical protein
LASAIPFERIGLATIDQNDNILWERDIRGFDAIGFFLGGGILGEGHI